MNILCIDIGGGTQDICCYNGKDTFENSFKMVIPTPSKRIADKIRKTDDDIFINGTTIGGGITGALKEKIAQGKSVFITEKAAPSVRDNLDYVRNLGINVVEEVLNPNIVFTEFDHDIIIPAADQALNGFEPDLIFLAVQDHGYIPGTSDRITRFDFLKNFLDEGLINAYYSDYNEIPEHMTRIKATYKSVEEVYPNKKIYITDTAIIASLGAVYDIPVNTPFITVDAGNCHTFAAAIDENKNVLGFFEHHTDSLNTESMFEYLHELANTSISHDKIYNEEGHGAFFFNKRDISNCPIYITGPNRNRFFKEGDNIIFANPKGDTMMTGPIGMLMQLRVDF